MALFPKSTDIDNMRKSFKYRLYPGKKQLHNLEYTLEECRWLFNETLGYRKNAWETEQRNANWYETKGRIPLLKEQRPSLKQLHSQVLQNVTERVDLGMQAFFRRVKAGEKEAGYPRFKGFGRYDSFIYTQTGFKLDGTCSKLELSKIGKVKLVLHRPIEGVVKTVTVTRSATGKWYACFSCEVEPKRLPENKQAVGIDVGLKTFASLSDGQATSNPRFFRREEKALAKVQRKLSKTEKGTRERGRRRKQVARVHERTRFKRADFSQQHSRRVVNQFGIICVEDLNINRLNQLHTLAKSIMDAAWSGFFTMIRAKAAPKGYPAGRVFIAVNPAYTSQTCSRCHVRLLNKLTLADRIFDCPECGLHIDRDLNAALNILALGLQSIGNQSVAAPAARPGE